MHANGLPAQPVTVVVGANATGSAIAHHLHAAGLAVVLLDDIDPAWTRRGRSYTDAWYLGVAELAGTPAVFCGSVRSIPAALDRGRAIAATTWSAGGVASALHPLAVVDARSAEASGPERGTVTIRPATDSEAEGEAWRLDVAPSPAPFVVNAPEAGRFHTHLSIGDAVKAGEPLGTLGARSMLASAAGRLFGLCARGARVRRGGIVAEIDEHADRDACFGLEPSAADAAASVLACLREHYRI